jgi:cytoskeletal protein CcmA (bactofilin family)/predicted Zn-ribbon and HTH transcriptional regulator
MFGSIKKIPTECPHCGFVQSEPAGLISTYCRGCGDHYSVAPRALHPPAPATKPAALGKLVREKLLARTPRRIACHKCGHTHDPQSQTQSTVCPACGTNIQLDDVEILAHSTRIVQTRGTVHVGPEGFLNATRVVCGNAFIEGRIAGKVTCEGTLRLRGSGLCRAKITTRRLIIDRGAILRFTSTLRVEEIVIRGQAEADVECVGTLHIGRYGGLEGDVQARAMVVDKGGHYTGEVQVSTKIIRPDPESASRKEYEVRVLPGWQTDLAFG